MTNLFLKLLNMSITASWLILAILLIRFLLRKAPKTLLFSLWILVAVKLISPYTFESMYSLIPSTNTIQVNSGNGSMITSGIGIIDKVINPIVSKDVVMMDTSMSLLEMLLLIGTFIWIIGAASMLIYSVLSYEKLQRKTEISMHLKDEIYICDHIGAPFILGIIKPKIYLPSNMDEQYMETVLAHEYTHLYRKDHIWKMIAYFILSLHWFNPLVWIAFILFTCDMESSCDEKTIQNMCGMDKKKYCSALVSLSEKNHLLFTYPLAFGEIDVKERVKQIVNYKKPSTWLIAIAIVLCLFITIGFMSGPFSHDIKITYGNEVYKYNTEQLNLTYNTIPVSKTKDGTSTDFYGPNTCLWRIYDKMGIYSLSADEDLVLKSVTIVSEDGSEYEIKDSGMFNAFLLKEKDDSLSILHTGNETSFVLIKKVDNVKEIILTE